MMVNITDRMLMRQERVVLLLLLGVAGIVILAHGSLTLMGNAAFARPFTNESPDGERVVLNGTIEQVSFTQSGGHVILLLDNRTVFIPAPAARGQAFMKGQNLTVYGVVEVYRGEKEIVVNSPDDIRIR